MTTMTTQPKISILIPVYNTAKYLPRCMASVLGQTLKDIEIIAVNDASPDNAAEVLAEYAAKDSRVKVVTHEKNGGILAARLSGIAAATGEYLIFLDADDFLDTDTARVCYAKIRATGADMIHFCFDVKVGHTQKLPFAKQVERRLRPYNGTLRGREVFEGAFVKGLYRWNICGKCISADVCRKAAAALPPGYYIMAEDFCFYTLMSWFAQHYEPLQKKCYHYGLEIGVSAYAPVDFKGFIRNCSVFTALNAVRHFLTEQGAFEQYRAAFQEEERKILDDLLDRWEHKLIQYDRERSISYMFGNYSCAGLMRSFISYFSGREDYLAEHIGHPEILRRGPASADVRHAGLYVDSAATGGDFARMLLACAQEWQKSGIRISVITPENDPVSVPDGMTHLVIPAGLTADSPKDRLRRTAFWDTLKNDHGIDTVIHGAPESPAAIFDMIQLKVSGLNFLAVPVNGFRGLNDSTWGHCMASMQTLLAADALAVQTEQDRAFFSAFGVPSCLLNLPVPEKIDRKTEKDSRTAVWLGSLGDPLEMETAVAAWAKAAPEFPDLNLLLIGKTRTSTGVRETLSLLDALQLNGKAEVCSLPDDLNPYLNGAALFFMTSARPDIRYMQLAEACGIPCCSGGGKSPEDLAEQLKALLNGKSDAGNHKKTAQINASDTLFALLKQPRPTADPNAFLWLDAVNVYGARTEPYVLTPETRGASFMPFYRKIDALGYKLLPPESGRRNFFFRACRYALNHLMRK